MWHFLFFSIRIFAIVFAASLSASSDWPYPEDVPNVMNVNIGVASDRPVDISRFLLARGVFSAYLNRKGTHLAYLNTVTGDRQLWVLPVKGGQAKQITFGNGISFYRWHPDGQQLIYGADNEGNEKEAYYLISMDGKKEKVLLPHSDGYRAFGAFDPAGQQFSYASTERNGLDFDIYLFDMATAKSRMVYQAEFGFFPAAWHPDGQRMLVTQTRGEDAQDVYLLDVGSGKLTTLFQPKVAAAYQNFNWKADGSGFYFVSNQRDEMLEVQYYDLAVGKSSTLVSSQYSLDELRLCHNGKNLVWSENQHGFEVMYVADAQGKNPQPIDLPQGVISLSCENSSTVIVTHANHASPSSLYTVSLDNLAIQHIVPAQLAGIEASELIAPQAVSFPARDGVMIHGLLYLPRKIADKKPPLVIDIHGGPTAQSKSTWVPLTQYLLGKGIAALRINVRGSTGYGKTYTRLDNLEKRLDSVRDVVDALAWLEKEGRVDTSRAAAIGGSYGGYVVNAVLGAYPGAFKTGASFVGVADWVTALQNASPDLKASDILEYGDIREPKWQAFYAKNSPINTVQNIKVPMFFRHGVNDPRNPVAESDQMVKILRDNGIAVTYLRFPDEGHSVSKLANRVIFYRQLAEFLERHL